MKAPTGDVEVPVRRVQSDGFRFRTGRDDLCGDERSGVGIGDDGDEGKRLPLVVNHHLGEGLLRLGGFHRVRQIRLRNLHPTAGIGGIADNLQQQR